MIKLFKIQGHSLFPLLKEGEIVLGIKPLFCLHVKIDDFVVFSHQPIGTMIKQVRSIDENKVFVVGTSADSIDSRDFGTIDIRDITYKILFKLPKLF